MGGGGGGVVEGHQLGTWQGAATVMVHMGREQLLPWLPEGAAAAMGPDRPLCYCYALTRIRLLLLLLSHSTMTVSPGSGKGTQPTSYRPEVSEQPPAEPQPLSPGSPPPPSACLQTQLSLADALCGCSIRVQHLDGTILEVPVKDVISPSAAKLVRWAPGGGGATGAVSFKLVR